MEMVREIEVDADATDAWDVLGRGFADIGDWATAIESSCIDGPLEPGSVRTCAVAGFGPVSAGEIKEKLPLFDPDAMAFTYVATAGLPPFMRSATNRWTISARAVGGSVIRTHATLQLAWWARPFGPLLRWGWRGARGTSRTSFGIASSRGCRTRTSARRRRRGSVPDEPLLLGEVGFRPAVQPQFGPLRQKFREAPRTVEEGMDGDSGVPP